MCKMGDDFLWTDYWVIATLHKMMLPCYTISAKRDTAGVSFLITEITTETYVGY